MGVAALQHPHTTVSSGIYFSVMHEKSSTHMVSNAMFPLLPGIMTFNRLVEVQCVEWKIHDKWEGGVKITKGKGGCMNRELEISD